MHKMGTFWSMTPIKYFNNPIKNNQTWGCSPAVGIPRVSPVAASPHSHALHTHVSTVLHWRDSGRVEDISNSVSNRQWAKLSPCPLVLVVNCQLNRVSKQQREWSRLVCFQ